MTSAPRRFNAMAIGAVLLAGAVLLYVLVPWSGLLQWATREQRMFQETMAGALQAIRGGDSLAILTLCAATAAYGFVHALGPGHGKVLLAGVALASGRTMRKMAVLTLVSSLAQAVSAILLVSALTFILGWAARDLVGLTETWLAPASALAIAAIGLLLILRGLRAWPAKTGIACDDDHEHHHHDHQHDHPTHDHGPHHEHDHGTSSDHGRPGPCGCGHAHGPTVRQVQSLTSTREALALVASIAMRPCTGALFVLVIAWHNDIFAAGCLAVLTMGLGTASFNLMVAASGVAARRLAALPFDAPAMLRLSAALHIAGGAAIAGLSLALAMTYLKGGFPAIQAF